jgi:Transposase, Mutator family
MKPVATRFAGKRASRTTGSPFNNTLIRSSFAVISNVFQYPSANLGLAVDHLNQQWGARYPALIQMWRSCWNEFIPFLDYDTEIRRVLCSTNAIESLNARYRRAIKARGHFPSEAAALHGPTRKRSAHAAVG